MSKSPNQAEFERRAAELAKLPRAQRFDQLLTFPNLYIFKAIGTGANFWRDIRRMLDDNGYQDIVLEEKTSAKGEYSSLSFSISVNDGSEIDRIYSALESIEGLAYLL